MNISSEQFNTAFSKLPYTIRLYLSGVELGKSVELLGKKYGLHIDTIGALDREVSNMLLGLENPQQFVGELKSVGVPETAIGPIVQELNELIFIPLHKKMQEAGPEESSDTYLDSNSIYENTKTTTPETVQVLPVSAAPLVSNSQPVFTSVPSYAHPQPLPTPVYQPPVYQPPYEPLPPQQVYQAPPVTPTPSIPPSDNRDELHKVMKEYGIDPYREPAD